MAGNHVLCGYVVRDKHKVFLLEAGDSSFGKNRSRRCVAAGKWIGVHKSKTVLGQIRRELMSG